MAKRPYISHGGEQAAGVLAQVKRDQKARAGETWSEEEEKSFKQPVIDTYEKQGHPYYASARLWDDGVIDPADTAWYWGCRFQRRLTSLSKTPNLAYLECRSLGHGTIGYLPRRRKKHRHCYIE